MSTLQSVRIKFDRKEHKKFSVRIADSKFFTPQNNNDYNKSLKNFPLPDYSNVLTGSLIEEYENEDKRKRKSERSIELYYKKEIPMNKNVKLYKNLIFIRFFRKIY